MTHNAENDAPEFIQCPHETIRATCVGGCNCPCDPCAPSRIIPPGNPTIPLAAESDNKRNIPPGVDQ